MIKKVETLEELEQVRRIRNECASYMTSFTGHIARSAQLTWWANLDKSTNILLAVIDGDDIVGYGLIRKDDADRWLVSAGLTERVRGKGLGRTIFQYMIDYIFDMGEREVWLEVLKTNTNAKALYDKLGFREVWQEEKIYVMVRRR